METNTVASDTKEVREDMGTTMKRFVVTLFVLIAAFVALSVIFAPEQHPNIDRKLNSDFDYSDDNCNFVVENLNII